VVVALTEARCRGADTTSSGWHLTDRSHLPRHTGEGRYLRQKWVPAFAGKTRTESSVWLVPLTKLLPEVILEGMNRQEILSRLRENETALRARGVSHAALFGSRARGDNRPDSDIDIMVEVDPEALVGVWGYVGLKEYISALFDGPVDVVDREALKSYVAPAATADAIYAF
jgi:predicted nucleotidyltransferase